MLHLIPPPLHRLALRLAHWLRKYWWRWRKPELVGVNVVLLDMEGQVLLVRHSYEGDRWTLPGGGLKRGELPAVGALRELAEELDCAVAGLTPIGVNERPLFGARCVTHLFSGELRGSFEPDGREVCEARFFCCESLPRLRSGMVDEGVAMLLKQR